MVVLRESDRDCGQSGYADRGNAALDDDHGANESS